MKQFRLFVFKPRCVYGLNHTPIRVAYNVIGRCLLHLLSAYCYSCVISAPRIPFLIIRFSCKTNQRL